MNKAFAEKSYNVVVSSLARNYKAYLKAENNATPNTTKFASWLIKHDPILSTILLSAIIKDHEVKGEI